MRLDVFTEHGARHSICMATEFLGAKELSRKNITQIQERRLLGLPVIYAASIVTAHVEGAVKDFYCKLFVEDLGLLLQRRTWGEVFRDACVARGPFAKASLTQEPGGGRSCSRF
jgi:hypothetical protein